MTALWREHTLCSYLWVSGWLHASIVNSPLERWVSGQLVVYFVNEVLLVSSHGCNTIYMFAPSCACLALHTSCHPLRSGIPAWAMKLLGKLEYRLVHSLQWAWGGDHLQAGFTGVIQPVWWSTEPLQPDWGDAEDVHVHCCTADMHSLTKAVNRQHVAPPQTA